MKRPIEVFSVGIDFIQVVFRRRGDHLLRLGEQTIPVSGPLAVATFTDLSPATNYSISVGGRRSAIARTLVRPPGELLARVATVSDTHIGEIGFLHWPRLWSQPNRTRFDDAHPVWALRAAADEIRAWSPDAVAVKGDVSHRDSAAEFRLAISILQTIGAPLLAGQGNHDGGNHRGCDAVAVAAELGMQFDQGVVRHDVRGAAVLMVESTIAGRSSGSIASHTTKARAAIDPAIPTLVFMHHQLMRWPFATYFPVGVPKPEADEFLRQIGAVSKRILVSSGHSHRNRSRRFEGIPVTEVGSTKDFPGVWAGYEVYEGGVVQSLRRIADPRVLTWTESTRKSMARAWGFWSPGRLKDRCFTHPW